MRRAGLYCSLVLFMAAVGCNGGGAAKVDTYKVTGKVSLNGAPVAGASVSFSPTQAGKPAAFAMTDSQGVYSLTTYDAGDGAADGEYKVMVSKSAGGDQESSEPAHDPTGQGARSMPQHAGSGGGKPGAGSLLPEKYAKASTTPITKTVEAKENVIDIEL